MAVPATISAISILAGILFFAIGMPPVGFIFLSISLLGILTLLLLVLHNLHDWRTNPSARNEKDRETQQQAIVRLDDHVDAIEKSTAEIERLANTTNDFVHDTLVRTIKNQARNSNEQIQSTDEFIKDTLVRTIKNQIKNSETRTTGAIDNRFSNAARLQSANQSRVLNELTSIKIALGISNAQYVSEQVVNTPEASRKPKDADYSNSFQKLESYVTSTTRQHQPASSNARVLFVSSNGAGLGHLTRLNAVDKALDAQSMFYTMSSAYKMIGKKSNEIVYFPSHGDLKMNGADWNPLMEEHFTAVVRGFKPDLIVFDGTFVYQGVISTSKELKVPLVWMQRGCWKEEVDKQSAQRHCADKFATAVLIPGDYGCKETVDVGPNLSPEYLPPITLIEKGDLLSREEARTRLHLPLDKKLFLVQLGAGNINDISDIRSKALEFVRELGDDWEPVLVRNPLSQDSDGDNTYSIQAYPLSLYYNAFDAGAFAAGYNTVQESIELQLPAVFVPNPQTKTDDQERRAERIAELNIGFVAADERQLHDAIINLSDDGTRTQIKDNQSSLREPLGAAAAASVIGNILKKVK